MSQNLFLFFFYLGVWYLFLSSYCADKVGSAIVCIFYGISPSSVIINRKVVSFITFKTCFVFFFSFSGQAIFIYYFWGVYSSTSVTGRGLTWTHSTQGEYNKRGCGIKSDFFFFFLIWEIFFMTKFFEPWGCISYALLIDYNIQKKKKNSVFYDYFVKNNIFPGWN